MSVGTSFFVRESSAARGAWSKLRRGTNPGKPGIHMGRVRSDSHNPSRRSLIIRVRIPHLSALGAIAVATGCGGPLPTTGAATGTPAAVAQVRLYSSSGADLSVHTGLPDDQSLRLETRLYASDGHRLTEIVGGVTMELRFDPESLATAAPVPGRPLERLVTALAPAGTAGTQIVDLFFPDAPSKTFGPFHVEVQRGGPANAEFRLFDAFNTDLTAHVPLLTGDTTRLEVRLYDAEGRRRTSIPGGAEVTFRFEPATIATALPVPEGPFLKDVTPTAAPGTEGSLFVSVLFLADSTTKTYGPIQVLVH